MDDLVFVAAIIDAMVYLTPAEVAHVLGVSLPTVLRWSVGLVLPASQGRDVALARLAQVLAHAS